MQRVSGQRGAEEALPRSYPPPPMAAADLWSALLDTARFPAEAARVTHTAGQVSFLNKT